MTFRDALVQFLQTTGTDAELRQAVSALLVSTSPHDAHPVSAVQWVPIEHVTPNDYNPNSVARAEMGLLYLSIKHDGYTQPIVTIWDAAQARYVIVDGFHRYYVMKTHQDIYDACHGLLPIVVLDKGMNDRMASTVRHNRARGKHSVQGMSSMVLQMFENGWSDAEIAAAMGMTDEEVRRLKHITGFAVLFADVTYQRAWTTVRQLKLAQAYRDRHSPSDLQTSRPLS